MLPLPNWFKFSPSPGWVGGRKSLKKVETHKNLDNCAHNETRRMDKFRSSAARIIHSIPSRPRMQSSGQCEPKTHKLFASVPPLMCAIKYWYYYECQNDKNEFYDSRLRRSERELGGEAARLLSASSPGMRNDWPVAMINEASGRRKNPPRCRWAMDSHFGFDRKEGKISKRSDIEL